MNKVTVIALVIVSAASPIVLAADTSNDAAIVALEKKAWQSYKERQPDAFKGVMAPTYAAVYAEGVKDINGELTDMKAVEIRSFDFAETKVSHPSADVAMLTYKVNAQGSANGTDISGTYNCGSVYVKQNGNWLGVFHTEVKAGR